MNNILDATKRTRLRRLNERGHFDRKTINAILDAMPLCHIGYVIDGSPVVMPTFQWREGDHIYWHASNGGRGVKAAVNTEICLTVSLLDGLVLAKSAINHSSNFRSVMIFGRPTLITDPEQKEAKLNGLIDALYPGRSSTLRPLTDIEIKQTAVLSLPIEEASAKIRDKGVVDDEEDRDFPVWAGIIPVKMETLSPQSDPHNIEGIKMPDHVSSFKLG